MMSAPQRQQRKSSSNFLRPPSVEVVKEMTTRVSSSMSPSNIRSTLSKATNRVTNRRTSSGSSSSSSDNRGRSNISGENSDGSDSNRDIRMESHSSTLAPSTKLEKASAAAASFSSSSVKRISAAPRQLSRLSGKILNKTFDASYNNNNNNDNSQKKKNRQQHNATTTTTTNSIMTPGIVVDPRRISTTGLHSGHNNGNNRSSRSAVSLLDGDEESNDGDIPIDVFLSSFLESADELVSSVYLSSLSSLQQYRQQHDQQGEDHPQSAFGIDFALMSSSISSSSSSSPSSSYLQGGGGSGGGVAYSSARNTTCNIPLPEDIFTLVDTQLNVLDEYLASSTFSSSSSSSLSTSASAPASSSTRSTDTDNALIVNAILSILRTLQWKQEEFRQSFLIDFDSCLAASNGWARMSDQAEELLTDLSRVRYSHLGWDAGETKERLTEWDMSISLVDTEARKLIDMYSQDSVRAAQHAAIYIMTTIQQSDIPQYLFSIEWEDELVQNEVARRIVSTFDDYLMDTKRCLETSYLNDKVVAALVRSTVCFYIQCLVIKADRARRRHYHGGGGGGRGNPIKKYKTKKNKRKKNGDNGRPFGSPNRALTRMKYDIEVFHDYFIDISGNNSGMKRLVASELSVLTILLEFMSYAAGGRGSGTDSLEEFVVVVHKRTGADATTTRNFLSDIYVLMDQDGSKHEVVKKTIQNMQKDLDLVTERVNDKRGAFGSYRFDGCQIVYNGNQQEKDTDSGATEETACFRLDVMLKALYEERKVHKDSSVCGTLRLMFGII